MEDLVRRPIQDTRAKSERWPKPSKAFARHFGAEHGVGLSPPIHCGYKTLSFSSREEE